MIEGAIWRRWVFFYFPLTAFVVALLFPFYWMLVTTVRPDSELYRPWNAPNYAPFWTTHPTLEHVKDLLNFEKSTRYSERQKAALAYAEAIAWHLDTDDAFWERLHRHYGEPELVELGCFIALTMGQQSWLRLLNIEHHQVLAGTAASMAPGYESPEALDRTKSDPDYWAKHKRA